MTFIYKLYVYSAWWLLSVKAEICCVVYIKSEQSVIAIDFAPSFFDTIFLGPQRTTDANESRPALM